MAEHLSSAAIHEWKPYNLVVDSRTPMQRTQQRLEQAGQWAPWQMLGRRFPIACVALEITQRCNLDCTYCYLSESSEALKDIPLEEVFRRIDLIHAHYGDHTDVQVTGGDPTLRKRSELIAIVRYLKQKNLRSSLFTNGIKATRDLLEALCVEGLEDVAFHVDLTQERKGYGTEASLNEIRQEYIERARGLPLSVFFNTTIYPDNFHEVPDLVKFFVKNCDVVRMAAFQTGADSGRGTVRERVAVNPETVQKQIEHGLGTTLDFAAAASGHASCNRYACALVINHNIYDLFSDPQLVQEILHETRDIAFARADKWKAIATMAHFIVRHPKLLAGFIKSAGGVAWKARKDLVQAGGRIGKMSFHIHNFMDAAELDRERCEACSFMVMTPEGPMSMCVHNAKRDTYLLVPTQVQRESKIMFWNPATGKLQDTKPQKIEIALTRKNARGRARAELHSRRTDAEVVA